MKLFALILITLIPLGSKKAHALDNALKSFETDGCTMFADGTVKRPGLWRHCCVEHDMRYWFGGDQANMDKTDLRLKACVFDVAGSFWAKLIYDGVRAGHSSPVKNKTHWGWGWVNERANIKLTEEESQYIIEELRRLPYDAVVIEKFIEKNFNIKHEAF